MKTAVIFNNFDNGYETVVVLDGDYSHLHNHYMNACKTSSELQDEIDAMVKGVCLKYDVEEWSTYTLPAFPSDEFYQAVKDGAKVIITGFVP